MAVTAHVFPSFSLAVAEKKVNLNATDTVQVALIASTGGTGNSITWNSTSEGFTTFSSFLAGSGAGTVVEVSGGGYSRGALTTAHTSVADSGVYTSFASTDSSIAWSSVTFTALYAVFIDNSVGGSDSTNQLICYWDFGGAQSVSAGTFTLTFGTGSGSVSNCIVQWTSS